MSAIDRARQMAVVTGSVTAARLLVELADRCEAAERACAAVAWCDENEGEPDEWMVATEMCQLVLAANDIEPRDPIERVARRAAKK